MVSRRIGNVRLIKANVESPYFEGLSDVLVKAFGPPVMIGEALGRVDGVEEAYVFGSWAARYQGQEGARPVRDIDLLVLGDPDRDALYGAVAETTVRLGREVQVTVRPPGWLTRGTGTFHQTVTSRPLVPVSLTPSADQR